MPAIEVWRGQSDEGDGSGPRLYRVVARPEINQDEYPHGFSLMVERLAGEDLLGGQVWLGTCHMPREYVEQATVEYWHGRHAREGGDAPAGAARVEPGEVLQRHGNPDPDAGAVGEGGGAAGEPVPPSAPGVVEEAPMPEDGGDDPRDLAGL